MIDLVIVSHNGKELTKNAIDSALKNTFLPTKIIIVDNNSTDGTVEFLKSLYDEIEIVSLHENYGYGKAANIGVQSAKSPFVVISNNDVIFPNFFFENLKRLITKSNVNLGIIGFQQIYPDGKYQNSYGKFHSVASGLMDVFFISLLKLRINKLSWKLGIRKIRKVDYVDGAVICVNKYAFESIGGFDEDFFFYSEEVDLCKRIKESGFDVIIDERNEVIHYRGQGRNRIGLTSESAKLLAKSRAIYCNKHLSKVEGIIYLTLEAIFFKELSILLNLKKMLFGVKNTDQISVTNLLSKEFWKIAKNFYNR